MSTAHVILAQLGGNKFIAMTGAKNFVGSSDYLQFDIPKSKGINKVCVTLDASDTYSVRFMAYNARKLEVNDVCEEHMVYADNLRAVFTRVTGLETRL